MPKKILIINGSPHTRGNTAIVVKWVAAGAQEMGTEIELVETAGLENTVNGCSGCRRCNTSEPYQCYIQDGTSALVRRILYLRPHKFVKMDRSAKALL